MDKKIHILGYASDVAANRRGAAEGPVAMQASDALDDLPVQWEGMFESDAVERGSAATSEVKRVCENLASHTAQFTKNQQHFLTLGGDHSSAIGTWSGAASALEGGLGLIWIDAHMDAHTPDTSKSQNIHGMPLAVLLGYGADDLTQIASPKNKLNPENLVLIGIRSFETGEAELLKRLGVRIYSMDEINKRGLPVVLKEALEIATKNTEGFGVSIDLDGIDPKDAPGVSLQAVNGIHAKDLLENLHAVASHPKFIGAEIAEFCPEKDEDQKTEYLIGKLASALFQHK